MRQTARAGALALLLALTTASSLASSGQAAAPKARPSAVSPLSGVNVAGPYYGPARSPDSEIALARSLHARVVRVFVPWAVLEPTTASVLDVRQLAFTDRLAADAAAHGIRIIMTVEDTPCWASSAPRVILRRCLAGHSSAANAWPPSSPAAYAAFVAYLARRYARELAAIEIWNEPDQSNQLYFAGPDKPRRYAAILRAAYVAIKRAEPAVPVLGGSLVGSNGTFLRALYAAGIKGYYDGLAVHFYNLVLGSVRSIREAQLANGDTKPLWLDEFGWTSCYPRHSIQEEQPCVTPAIQAANLANAVRALARAPYIAAEVSYELQDSGGESFGVIDAGGARKPAFAALQQAFASPLAPLGAVSLGLSRHGDFVIARGSGPVGDFMGLEAFQGSVPRYRALFLLDRFNRYSIPLPAQLGTSGLRVRVFQYWSTPAGAAERTI